MSDFMYADLYQVAGTRADESTINGCIDYTIDLFMGISRNNNYCFGRSMNLEISIENEHILIRTDFTPDKTNSFLSFIALLQFIMVDEQIFLGGSVSLENSLVDAKDITDNAGVRLNIAEQSENDEFQISFDGEQYISFIKRVYSFSPYKDEEGNFKRHIITPVNKFLKAEGEKGISSIHVVMECIDSFATEKGYSSVTLR